MEEKDRSPKRLPAALVFIEWCCWLTIVITSIRLLSGRWNETNPVIEIFCAGLALYIALGIRARDNIARLVVISVLTAGGIRAITTPAEMMFQSGDSLSDIMTSPVLAKVWLLFVIAFALTVWLYVRLLQQIRSVDARIQFVSFCQGEHDVDKELAKERIAIWIGVIFAAATLLFRCYIWHGIM